MRDTDRPSGGKRSARGEVGRAGATRTILERFNNNRWRMMQKAFEAWSLSSQARKVLPKLERFVLGVLEVYPEPRDLTNLF